MIKSLNDELLKNSQEVQQGPINATRNLVQEQGLDISNKSNPQRTKQNGIRSVLFNKSTTQEVEQSARKNELFNEGDSQEVEQTMYEDDSSLTKKSFSANPLESNKPRVKEVELSNDSAKPKVKEVELLNDNAKPKLKKVEFTQSSITETDKEGEFVIRTSFESRPTGKHSYEYFCLQDLSKSEDYKILVDELGDLKNSSIFKDVGKFKNLNLMDNEMRKDYDSNLHKSAYAGFKIIRTDSKNRKTNLVSSTANIEIQTLGMNSKSALRIPLAGGEFIELGLDDNGNFNGKAIPLTADGAEEEKLHTLNDNNCNLIYNRYENVLKDIGDLTSFKINGVDVRESIIKSIEAQKESEKEFTSEPLAKKAKSPNLESLAEVNSDEKIGRTLDLLGNKGLQVQER